MNTGPASPRPGACPGPFIWYECSNGAILLCAACGHLTVTPNWNESMHAATPVLREGLGGG